MAGTLEGRLCPTCGSDVGFTRADDGYFYCDYCNSQAEGIVDTGMDEEQLYNIYNEKCSRVRPANFSISQPIETISQVKLTTSQFLDHPNTLEHPNTQDAMNDGVGPTEPTDFAPPQKNYSYEDYYTEIRSRYVTGLQLITQLQSKVLVEKFNVSPLIIGLVGPIWLRLLASTKVLVDEWADQAVHDSETQTQGEAEEFQSSANYRNEPVNIHGKSLVHVWCRSLRSALPITWSLVISLLVCHMAREPILPTDILKWALEGKLPYLSAFLEIEKQLGSCTKACPIRASTMFRPIKLISSQKLESMAAIIAHKIGLKLPHVNFYAIASRYLWQLSLPAGIVLPSACHIYEWSMPAELYISAHEGRIPTRACVMSILIVAIRKLFDINGYGMWESSLSSPSRSSSSENENDESHSRLNKIENADDDSPSHDLEPSNAKDHRLGVSELLQILDSKYYELSDSYDYTRDLPAYLKYCKDVVFSGLKPSSEVVDEKMLIDELWEFYQNNKGDRTPDENETSGENYKGDRCSKCSTDSCNCSHQAQDSAPGRRTPKGFPKEKALRQLKLDMEENQFCYIPPRARICSRDYLHYARRRKSLQFYAVHADYYILLRCCAKVALVETRIMHTAVLCLERRLQWLEKKIDRSLLLHSNLDSGCDLCDGDVRNAEIDPTISDI